jgi:hypothetical protein
MQEVHTILKLNSIRTSHNNVYAKQNPSFFKTVIQPKLTINEPGDIYEQEADLMADRVLQMPINDQSFFSAKTIPFSGLQRTCTQCQEEEKKLHRKQSNSEQAKASDELEGYVDNLNSNGRSLPDNVRSFFEPRFESDFSDVRIHTDSAAAKSAQSINALAYTSRNHIVFNENQFSPETGSGKKLMAHELTHVVQQGNTSPGLLQRKRLSPAETQLQEQDLKAKFQAISAMVDTTQPTDEASKKKIQGLVKEFFDGFATYDPYPPGRELFPVEMPMDYMPEEFEPWKHSRIYSLQEATDLSARLDLIGLNNEAIQMYKLGNPASYKSPHEFSKPDQYYESYTKAAVDRIDISSVAKIEGSLDVLLKAAGEIAKRINKLDRIKIREDKVTVLGPDESLAEMGGWTIRTFYLSLIFHIREIFTATQQMIQAQMEKLFGELDSTGEAPSFQNVLGILTKIHAQFSTIKVPLVNRSEPATTSTGGLDPDKITPPSDGEVSLLALNIPVTKTDFTPKGGMHRDIFHDDEKAPSIGIEYYDRQQTEGKEKILPLSQVLVARIKQLDFIRSFYGLDQNGKKIAGTQGPQTIMPANKFSLFSLDDWRVFLDKKFEDLTINQGVKTADAFVTIIRLLESYMKAFTIHTPFNIVDKGDANNYLNKTFPRALTGQLIQDCGVYALKTVYLLSLLAPKIRLQIQYIMLPNHVGLIIKGDQTPVVFVHNDDFSVVPVSESQFDDLNKENQKTILSDTALDAYDKAKKSGDTSAFGFTIDKMKQGWLKDTKDQNLKASITDEQFLAEHAANLFISQPDMPFALIKADPKHYDPKLKTGDIKKKLWQDYVRMTQSTELFNPKALRDRFSPTDQFNLRYLQITVASKNFHNEILLPFWNKVGREKWIALSKDLEKAKAANDEKAYLTALKSYQTGYLDDLDKLSKGYEPVQKAKADIRDVIESNDVSPLKRSISRSIGARGIQESWMTSLISHRDALAFRIMQLENKTENMNNGTDITPAFANPADKLIYQP